MGSELQERVGRAVMPMTLAVSCVGTIVAGFALCMALGVAMGMAGLVAGLAGLAGLYVVGVILQEASRSRLRDEAFLWRGPAVDANPVRHFFVTRWFGPEEEELPQFVVREAMAAVVTGLGTHRFVIVVAGPGSGLSRLVYEVACKLKDHVALVARRMGVPSEDPLARLMRDRGGMVADDPQVLYLRDFASRVISGGVNAELMRDWLARHPQISVVATLSPADARRIAAAGDEANAEYMALAGLATVVSLPARLQGEELADAAEKFPWLSAEQREWLPRHLIASHPLRERFSAQDGHRLGRAIVYAIADWSRAGATRPAPTDYVRRAAARYLNGGGEAAELDAELAWALEEIDPSVAMIYAQSAEDGSVEGYRADGAIVALLDNRDDGPQPVPDFVWEAVQAELSAELVEGEVNTTATEELIAVGEAALGRGLAGVGGRILRLAARHGTDHQHQRVVQILTAGTAGASAPQSLVTSRRGDGILPRLHAVHDLANARRARPNGPRGGEPGGPRAWIYRRTAMRTAMRLFLLAVADAGSAALGLAVGLVLRDLIGGVPLDWGSLVASFVGSLALWSAIAVFSFALVKLYKQDSLRARLGRIVLAMSVLGGIGLVATLADGYGPLAAFGATTFAWFAASSVDYRLRVRYDRTSRSWVMDHGLEARTLLIGSARQVAVVRGGLDGLSRPTEVVGYLDATGRGLTAEGCLGSLEDLGDAVAEYSVGRILIVDTEMEPRERQVLADRCHLLGLRVEAVPSVADARAGGAEFVVGQSLALVRLVPLWQSDPGFFAKRALDVLLALGALAALLPLLLAISLVTKATSGQVITRSWRPGLGGSVFGMYRFRTTKRGAGASADPSDPDGDSGRDTTRFGGWLRDRGLDELPQLFNVLLGQMSLVGPRPLRTYDHGKLVGDQLLRYVVRPGVTSPWQVCDRQALTHAELATLDLAYLRRWSILVDLEIVVKTARLMLRGRSTLPRLVDADDVACDEEGPERPSGPTREVGPKPPRLPGPRRRLD